MDTKKAGEISSIVGAIGSWVAIWVGSFRTATDVSRTGGNFISALTNVSLFFIGGLLVLACVFTFFALRGIFWKPLIIHKALYGTNFGSQDFTDLVRMQVRNGRLTIKVGSDLFGDPCPNQFKRMIIEYSVKGRHFTKEIQQDNWCSLP
jgi:hypothetical protein